ncbi:bifunctional 3-phenylpropionate/cinnamic acid dioxygenase ferredoxin subunit [Geodermatophilus ruber]|uniref:Rieske [2Fe-2S] domain-containing protein n=1 Tax=Geodermatophilus ruber TaxID=504800 RepID=A0A1I4GLB0_9ACTN|nr:bifunctional 3-phenylpropionate/cinnamic acid dioxygenase ferredoxin subunit [Geodermatophilus ruber]SFL29896.1 Rieske [2Fe-2S] domain-containing protein [Geodermatophilus ruber]
MEIDVQMTFAESGARWIRACAVDDVEDDEAVRLGTQPPVTVFRSEGEFFCIDDTCTHETYSLSEGWVENCLVECTLHMAKFDLRTGRPLSPPARSPVRVHQLRVEDGSVFVQLPNDYTCDD